MKHYDEYGTPTHEHEEMVLKSLGLASEILKGGYISRIESGRVGKNGFYVEILFMGSGSGKRVLPKSVDADFSEGWEVLEYALDEVELEVARKVVSALNGTDESKVVVSVKRKNLHRFPLPNVLLPNGGKHGISDSFIVTWAEGKLDGV